MIPFSDWLKIKESSPATRIKTQAALGLAPPVADIFSRATPPPWQVERLTKALKKSHRKRRGKKKRKMNEASKPVPIPKDFDAFIASVEALAKDLYELKSAMKKPKPKSKKKDDTEDKVEPKNGSKPAKDKKKQAKDKDSKPEKKTGV